MIVQKLNLKLSEHQKSNKSSSDVKFDEIDSEMEIDEEPKPHEPNTSITRHADTLILNNSNKLKITFRN